MQKVKYGFLNIFIAVVAIALGIVISCCLILPKKVNAEDSPARGINFISATTKIKQTEPNIIGGDYYSPYVSDMNSFYLVEDTMGEYVKFGNDYIKIQVGLYCNASGTFLNSGSLSNASPTDYINISEQYNNKVLTISNCLLYEINGNKYIYDGVNIYCYIENGSPIFEYCSSNGAVATDQTTPTNYLLIKSTEQNFTINLNASTTKRYNAIFNYGYNYKQFEQYSVSSILNGENLFESKSNINPLEEYYYLNGNNDYIQITQIYKEHTSGTGSTITISDQTDYFNLDDDNYTYYYNSEDTTNPITELYTLRNDLYFNSPLGYFPLSSTSFASNNSKYTIKVQQINGDTYTYNSAENASINSTDPIDNLFVELLTENSGNGKTLHVPLFNNLFEKASGDTYYGLYYGKKDDETPL